MVLEADHEASILVLVVLLALVLTMMVRLHASEKLATRRSEPSSHIKIEERPVIDTADTREMASTGGSTAPRAADLI